MVARVLARAVVEHASPHIFNLVSTYIVNKLLDEMK